MRIRQPISAAAAMLALSLPAGCASGVRRSTNDSNVIVAKCESTRVKVTDLARFGFAPVTGKVVVLRLLRINCPYCKDDLLRIGALFQSNSWSKEHLQLFLIAYRKEGVEDRNTFDAFMREELGGLGIPPEAAQVVYIDKDYYSLVKVKNAGGDPIFEGWKAVPFGMVFGKDGRLAYRGHFTTSTSSEDEHYGFITALQKEDCPTPVSSAQAAH